MRGSWLFPTFASSATRCPVPEHSCLVCCGPLSLHREEKSDAVCMPSWLAVGVLPNNCREKVLTLQLWNYDTLVINCAERKLSCVFSPLPHSFFQTGACNTAVSGDFRPSFAFRGQCGRELCWETVRGICSCPVKETTDYYRCSSNLTAPSKENCLAGLSGIELFQRLGSFHLNLYKAALPDCC